MAIVATFLLIGSRNPRRHRPGGAFARRADVRAEAVAHDVTGFSAHKSRAPLPLGPQIYNDSVASDSDANVLNPSGDIGRTQYIQAQNGIYFIYSRLGHLLAGVNSVGFWSDMPGPDAAGLCSTNPQGEPSVTYDQLADRWVVAEAAYAGGNAPVAPFVECVAVSTTADATGTWNRYVFSVSNTLFPNRPTLGVWSDGYYLSFNQHTANGTFAGAGALALQRSQMLLGLPAQARYFDDAGFTPRLGGMLPASINGPYAPDPVPADPITGSTNPPELYLQAHDDPLDNNDRLEVWQFLVDWALPVTSSTFTPQISLPTNTLNTEFYCGAASDSVACLVQNGGTAPIARSGLYGQASRPGDLRHCVRCTAAARWASPVESHRRWRPDSDRGRDVNGGSTIADPAWFKLTKAVPSGSFSIGAQGVYDVGDGTNRFLPSVALDDAGNVGLAFALTGPGHATAFGYTEANNPGAVGDNVIVDGTAPSAGDTWGRYTTLSLDPIDRCTFWVEGPYTDSSHVAQLASRNSRSRAALRSPWHRC